MYKKKIFIVIAAFNEESVIDKVINEIKKLGYTNIIVVDDGSNDKTFQKAKKTSVLVFRHFINRGKGAAIKTGIKAAEKMGADIIVTLDADGQHNPENLNKMVESLFQGYDVVLGSRITNHQFMPITRIIFNMTANLIIFILYGLWVNDSQSGFRVYSKKAFTKIYTKKDRYEYDSEVIKEIAKHKLSFVEVPIDVRYTQYSTQKVYKQSFNNGIRMLIKMIAT